MGDLRDWSPEPNGAVTEDKPILLSSLPCNPNPATIDAGCWEIAENATREIISHVQPTVVSEKRRKEVICYVQSLIRDSLGCEVFQFGSVPLKTYLPDGDIDLTAFGALNLEDALANDVRSVLEREEQNTAAKFVIKDVQLIRAEVKLVKCLVQNIVVDISFNQLGGLCTLCFLEQVDRLISKSNLFKRSIILIKAWCYYESRILGAHHGLISTYALETLVLYIFHLFHSSLNGPLAVLYKFLDHFSKFDWDNYCISLNGPIRISSLPELVAEAPENGGGYLLLGNKFLRGCMEMFAVSSRVSETTSRTFPQKHLNIVDPLRENNNLGRSVSKGNFYRIRSAFNYGARKLGRILSHPEESLADEIRKFFSNTLDRHGKDLRPDVQDHVPLSGYNGFGLQSPSLEMGTCQEDTRYSELGSADVGGMFGHCVVDLEESFSNGVHNVQILSKEMELSRSVKEPQRGSMRIIPSAKLLEVEIDANRMAVSGFRLSGDAKDLATSRIQGLKISDDTPKSSRGIEGSMSPVGKAYHAPHLYFSRSNAGNGEVRNESPQQKRSDSGDNKESSGLVPVTYEETGVVHNHQDKTSLSRNGRLNSVSVDGSVVDFDPGYEEKVSAGTAGSSEALDSLPNLSGEYENHLNSLQYGRWCYEYALSAPTSPVISRFQSKEQWEMRPWSPHFSQDMFSNNASSLVPQPAFYPPVNQLIIPGPAFGREEKPKPRGTGTYFPNTNHYRDRPSTPRGRNQAQVRSPRNNGHAVIPPEINLPERSSLELSQAQFPALQGGGRPRASDLAQSNSPGRKVNRNANGSVFPAERGVEFAHVVDPQPEATSLESSRVPVQEHSFVPNPNSSLPMPQMQRQKSALGANQDKAAKQVAYQLKDVDDFPPLAV